MGSELIYRGHEAQTVSDTYSPKPHKPWLSVIRPIRYLLREQRLIFVLVGIAIATLVFTLLHSTNNGPYGNGYNPISETNLIAESTHQPNRFLFHPSRAQRIRKVGGKSESGVGEKTMGLTDSINSAADVVKQNVPGLTSIKDACRSTYDLGWTAVGKLSSAAGSLKPDLAPVKSAYLASYDCGWTAADKVSNAVRRVVGVTVTPYLPDEEGKARISQLATILAKNTGRYAFREGFKLVPGGRVFYEIVTRSISEEKKPQDDYKATIETLQVRIDRLEKQSRGSTKLASSQAMIGHRAEPDSGKPLPGGVYQAQSQIFKMKELFGRRSG